MTSKSTTPSRLGLGLYQGEESDEMDSKMLEVMQCALDHDITFFDCAPSYRNLRSEKILGDLLQRNPSKDLIISTKGGFVPFDFKSGIALENEFVESMIKKGWIRPELFDQHYFQTFDFNYLDRILTNTLTLLNRSYIDIYYLHNPEYFLERVGRQKFLSTMREVFFWIKSQLSMGRIKSFGISSWLGFFNQNEEVTLQLQDFICLAKDTGIEKDFCYIQIPFNFSQTQGLFLKNQSYEQEKFSLIRLANLLDISIVSSAPLGQGRLLRNEFPERVKTIFKDMSTPQINLSFALSTPGIASTLMGTTSLDHFKEVVSVYLEKQFGEQRFIETIRS